MVRAEGHRCRWHRLVAGLCAVALLGSFLGVAAEVVEPADPASAGGPDGTFIATTPCRVVDTRAATPASQLGPGAARTLQVAGSGGAFVTQGGADGGCGVPTDAVAVELSFTAISPSGANGFLRAGPGGVTPTGAILNYTLGTGITNTGTVPLAAAALGTIAVVNFGGTIHLAVDVQGYFVNGSGPRFVPVTPCRMVDTRASVPAGPFAVDETRTFRVAGSGAETFGSPGVAPQGGVAGGCGVPEQATAVELTVTAASPEGAGFLRAGPNTVGAPTGTLLNFTATQGVSNTASVAFVGDGLLKVKVFGARTQVLVDVQGYYVPTGAESEFVAVTPCRVVDTRAISGPTSPPLAAGETRSFAVTGTSISGQGGVLGGCGVPANAAAVEVSVTAAAPVGSGFLRVWPSGNAEPPATILNYASGRGITNTATVALSRGTADQLSVRNFGGSTHVVLDVQGYFTGPLGADSASVGNGFGCTVDGGGDVYCWGANALGQLGRGSQTFQQGLQPGATTLFDAATEVDLGRDHACARLSTGTVACWGANFAGQIGTGSVSVSVPSPTVVTSPSLTNVIDVSAGFEHSCAVAGTGIVFCWGRNTSGQLGDGTTTDRQSPVQVSGLTGVTQVSVGYLHTCARRLDGTVRCWGANFSGQLGNGTTTNSTVPVTVSGLTGVRTVATGAFGTCADDTTGALRCWGNDSEGQLGRGTSAGISPVPVVASITNVADRSGALAGGPDGFCAVDTSDVLRCWGDGTSFLFADGNVAHRFTPTTVATGVATVALGGDFQSATACAVRIDGGLRCWGTTSPFGDGAGSGNPYSGSSVTPVPGPSLPAGSTPSLSEWFSGGWGCAVAAGTVRCWGANDLGQLGDGTTTPRVTPAPVTGLSGVTQVATGAAHACAVLGDGSVRCWGRGGSGATADPLTPNINATPITVAGLGGTAVAVAASSDTTCALLSTGTVRCWGTGSQGELGNGTPTPLQVTPVTVSGLTNATQLTAGVNHFCAVAAGAVRCWGQGSFGQLGAGVTAVVQPPVTAIGSGAARVAAGFLHTCAQLLSGAVSCWGDNGAGQIGDGTFTARPTPTPVPGLSGVSSLSASGSQTCGVVAGGVRCWGSNQYGQIGDGTTADRATPVPVFGLSGVTSVEVGYSSACARRADGTLRCWGDRARGGLGSAPITSSLRPVQKFGF